jgi:serine/threonine protein kinase
MPIEFFESPRHLLKILKDSIQSKLFAYGSVPSRLMQDGFSAHRELYTKANLLHRDISMGNILINLGDDREEHPACLIDLDHATEWDDGVQGTRTGVSKITGTRPYMNTRLLKQGAYESHKYQHQPRDDVESHFWVLCHLVIDPRYAFDNSVEEFSFRPGEKRSLRAVYEGLRRAETKSALFDHHCNWDFQTYILDKMPKCFASLKGTLWKLWNILADAHSRSFSELPGQLSASSTMLYRYVVRILDEGITEADEGRVKLRGNGERIASLLEHRSSVDDTPGTA